MIKQSILVKFGMGASSKSYDYLTYHSNIQLGDRVFVETVNGIKSATAMSYPNTIIPDHATKWVVAHANVEHHQAMLKELEDGNPDTE